MKAFTKVGRECQRKEVEGWWIVRQETDFMAMISRSDPFDLV